MSGKIDRDRSYGEKIIYLFAKLLFSHQKYSLTELSRMLNCSKQTILRLVDDISLAYNVQLDESFEGNRKYYQIRRKIGGDPLLNLTESEISALQMCRAFTEHLLGHQLFQEATQALEKSQAHLPENKRGIAGHFASFIPGSIDYTPKQAIIQSAIQAMEEKKVCKVTYKKIMANRAKTYFIKPLKLFSHKDSIYLHTRLARRPGKKFKEPEYDPLLAIHRIEKLEITDRFFEFPKDYDFASYFNEHFGIIKGEAFEVAVEFSGWAARYVSERIWSPDQKIVRKKGGKIKLTFTASSKPELIGWILNFAEEARVLKPDWLAEEIMETIEMMGEVYER